MKHRGSLSTRGKVQWTAPTSLGESRTLPPYRDVDTDMGEEQLTVLASQLVVGSMWTNTCSMNVSKYDCPIQYLVQTMMGTPMIPVGSILIYSGAVRAPEVVWPSGKTLNVVRHTFVTSTGLRCIVQNVSGLLRVIGS